MLSDAAVESALCQWAGLYSDSAVDSADDLRDGCVLAHILQNAIDKSTEAVLSTLKPDAALSPARLAYNLELLRGAIASVDAGVNVPDVAADAWQPESRLPLQFATAVLLCALRSPVADKHVKLARNMLPESTLATLVALLERQSASAADALAGTLLNASPHPALDTAASATASPASSPLRRRTSDASSAWSPGSQPSSQGGGDAAAAVAEGGDDEMDALLQEKRQLLEENQGLNAAVESVFHTAQNLLVSNKTLRGELFMLRERLGVIDSLRDAVSMKDEQLAEQQRRADALTAEMLELREQAVLSASRADHIAAELREVQRLAERRLERARDAEEAAQGAEQRCAELQAQVDAMRADVGAASKLAAVKEAAAADRMALDGLTRELEARDGMIASLKESIGRRDVASQVARARADELNTLRDLAADAVQERDALQARADELHRLLRHAEDARDAAEAKAAAAVEEARRTARNDHDTGTGVGAVAAPAARSLLEEQVDVLTRENQQLEVALLAAQTKQADASAETADLLDSLRAIVPTEVAATAVAAGVPPLDSLSTARDLPGLAAMLMRLVADRHQRCLVWQQVYAGVPEVTQLIDDPDLLSAFTRVRLDQPEQHALHAAAAPLSTHKPGLLRRVSNAMAGAVVTVLVMPSVVRVFDLLIDNAELRPLPS